MQPWPLAPAVLHAFTPESLRALRAPVLVIGATEDRIAPATTNAAYLAETSPGAVRVDLRAAHYSFLSECGPAGPRPLCTDPEGVDRGAVHQEASTRAIGFFDRVWAEAVR
jgi:predicted dienelactone hydrolase